MDEPRDGAGAASSLHPDEVLLALRSVLASGAFATSRRSREFLSYVVTERLAGRGDRLSERTVGRRALGRDADFDGRWDSSVRVRATRVRASLAAYYAREGAMDAIRIELPPGRYAPEFVRAGGGPPPPDERPLSAGLVVKHFDVSGDDDPLLTGVTVVEALVQRLSSFGDLTVVGPVRTGFDDPRDIARDFGVRFVVLGSAVAREHTLRLTLRLVDGSSGSTVWTTTSTSEHGRAFTAEDRWAAEMAAQLGDSSGVLHSYEWKQPPPGMESSSRAAHRSFHLAQQVETPESVSAALAAIDRAIAEGDRSSTMLALRAWVGVAAVKYGVAGTDELHACQELAREAAAADPSAGLPRVALGMVALLREDYVAAGHHGHEAAIRGPHHPTVLLAAATLTCLAGRWEEGEALAREAIRLNPRHPGDSRWLLALARLLDDDPAQALAEASLVHTPGQIWGHLYRAMSLGGVGHPEQAAMEMRHVVELDPLFLEDPMAPFRAGMRLTPEHAATLSRYLLPLVDHDDGDRNTARTPRGRETTTSEHGDAIQPSG